MRTKSLWLRVRLGLWLAGAAALSMLAVAPAGASFITWEVNEVFSNADGTIQFVEFFESNGQNGQRSFDGKQLKTFVAGAPANDALNVHTFNDDVASDLTANRFALVATEGFASLPGAVEPDFVMPDGFIDVSVVVKIKLGNIDEFSFAQGAIPTGGVNSLHRTGTSVRLNSPTNFAGQAGSIDVPEPSATALGAVALVCIVALRQVEAAAMRRKGTRR